MAESRQFVESFNRGFKLLQIVCSATSPLGLSELAKACQLSISTTQRLTYTLQRLALLERNQNTKKFKIGPGMMELAFCVINNLTMTKVANPYMKQLRDQIGEVVGLGVLAGSEVMMIEILKAEQILNVNTNVGVRIPFHSTATGKAILAYLPESTAKKLLTETDLHPFTKHTVTTINAFMKLLPEVRKQGYAISIDENTDGLSAVSSPVRGNDGEVLAALTAMAPTARVNKDKLVNFYADKVIQTADRISQGLGYRVRTVLP